VGTGLIGGSIGLGLRRAGWHVTGTDRDEARLARALELGAVDASGTDALAEVTFVATPVGAIAPAARVALAAGPGAVTDVGGVKASVVSAVDHERFIGGHPMAGSEQGGVDGADPDLFVGATWVLTPTPTTDPRVYALVHSVITSLGADVIALDPARHDALVAVVSHVPHLTAAALMRLASAQAPDDQPALLRLAAGGFRDMTRIAAGEAGIWPDVCADNASAIVSVLDSLMAAMDELRGAVAARDREALLATLEQAQAARRSLPARRAGRAAELVEFRVPVPDRPGVIAEITTLASDLGVNVEDIEIAHSAEGPRGVLVIVVDALERDGLRSALVARGYRPSVQALGPQS